MCRFITPDTIVPQPYNPQSLNRYSYCLNNPLKYVDPSGHEYNPTDEDWKNGFTDPETGLGHLPEVTVHGNPFWELIEMEKKLIEAIPAYKPNFEKTIERLKALAYWDWMRANGSNPSKAAINKKINNIVGGLDNITGNRDTFLTAVKAMLWTESSWQQYNVGNSMAGTTNLNANIVNGVIDSVDIGIGMINTKWADGADIRKLASDIDYNFSLVSG